MNIVLVFIIMALSTLPASALTRHAFGGDTHENDMITHRHWGLTCYGSGRPFSVEWDARAGVLTILGPIARSYPAVSTQKSWGFEVTASRADQERTLHVLFLNGRTGSLTVVGIDGDGRPGGVIQCADMRGWE